MVPAIRGWWKPEASRRILKITPELQAEKMHKNSRCIQLGYVGNPAVIGSAYDGMQ